MELDRVGKKSGIKLTVYSLQNAVCCSAVIFHEGLPCGAEWVRSPGEDATMEPFTVPLRAQSQHPYIIIHTGKKAGGTFAERKGWGTAELSRHPEYSASSISRTYREITSLVRK